MMNRQSLVDSNYLATDNLVYIQFSPGVITDCQFEFWAFIDDKQPKLKEYSEIYVIKTLNLNLVFNYYLFKYKIIEFYEIYAVR